MPLHIRHLRAIRRRAWFLVALSACAQITSASLNPTAHSGAALAAPLQEIAR